MEKSRIPDLDVAVAQLWRGSRLRPYPGCRESERLRENVEHENLSEPKSQKNHFSILGFFPNKELLSPPSILTI
jgi:hypothetical protein